MGMKYPGLLLVFLLPALIGSASGAIYVENATVFDFSLNAVSAGLNSSLDGVAPRIFTEHVDSLVGENLVVASGELNNSLNAVRPRIFTEHVDSLVEENLIVAPAGLNNSLNAVRPRIFTEHVDSLFDNNLNDIPTELNSSVAEVRPRIFIENIDSLWNSQMVPFIGTPTPPPLAASITLPTNNFYSEELVKFNGTASGGVPPYNYTWTSNHVAEPLNVTIKTSSTVNEFSKVLAFNNKTKEMNKHTINLTVNDSTGNSINKTLELNVVVQKVKVLIVPVVPVGGAVLPKDSARQIEAVNRLKAYYLKSSYGSIYLDFTDGPMVESNVISLVLGNGPLQTQIIDDLNTSLPGTYGIDLKQYDILAITDSTLPAGYQDVTITNLTVVNMPLVAMLLRNDDGARVGGWAHEIGHALGNVLRTSELNIEPYKSKSEKTGLHRLLWGGAADDCNDLYVCGNVGGWDLMAKGNNVYGSEKNIILLPAENFANNQPTDMSVVSKIKLGWLSNSTILGVNGAERLIGEYPVMSTENMHYNDTVLVYKTSPLSDHEYYIEARELIQPSNYLDYWRKILGSDLYWWYTLNNGIVIYEVDRHSGMYVNTLNSNSEFKPTFLASEGTAAKPVIDVPEFVKFSVTESNIVHPYNAKIKVEFCNSDCQKLEGAILVDGGINLPNPAKKWIFSDISNNSTSPDLDLHAVTPDGLHIGMNYTSGEYELQIPGGVTSGDLIGGEEWIFVPTGTEVRYYVDSHDVQKYLEENPDIDPANATMNYSITSMEYGENPQRLELPDGNWTVMNRTVSEPQNGSIEPGVIMETVTEPPASIRNLTNITYASNNINFTWLNPTDPDFSHVMLYLNGSFKTNITAPQNYYNFTGLAPDTVYELGTHTVDTSGNINQTWVNATAKTAHNTITPTPSITIVSPDGGENWARGTIHTIRWNYSGTPGYFVNITLLKSGVFNRIINSNISIGSGGSGSYSWLIDLTQAAGTDYKIMVTSTTNPAYNDTSSNDFNIPAASITIVSPNGEESMTRGTTQTIKWNSSGSPGAYVKIELMKAGIFNRTIIASTPNDGKHPWLIPATQAPGIDYKVKITSTANASYNDTSDNSFTIPVPSFKVVLPNGKENWIRGTTQTIRWNSTENPKSYVKIELLKSGILNRVIIASTLNDGSNPWLIPATQLPGTDYKIRISSTTNLSNNDTSDNSFTIPTPSFTVVSPNGSENWVRGTTKTIRWNSTESPGTYVKIELLKPGVANKVIISSTLNDGSHPWLIPANQVQGTDYKVKVTSTINASVNDTSDNTFTIPAPSFTIVSPNGGENWTRGTTQTIKWNSTESPGTYVRIELLKPGATNKVIISSTLNDGSHPWLIPAAQLPGDDYKVKITSTTNASVNDTSDNNFSIVLPKIIVTSPNGGENWIRGTTHLITWNYTGNPGTYVKIELLKGGVVNRTILSSTLNDKSQGWTIPATQAIGADYKIRITSTTNLAYNDTSDGNFNISSTIT